ncbi:MAG: hypothetical protein D6814_06765 [Calditrichaeota bacterium]|nr:MAG: hypothetical protein D6814_06765 [Calditrichota bacterium]
MIYLQHVQPPKNPGYVMSNALTNRIKLVPAGRHGSGVKIIIPLPARSRYKIGKTGGLVWLQVLRAPQPDTLRDGYTFNSRTEIKVRQNNSLLRQLSRGDPINVDFRNAEIGNVLRILARQNGFNVVAGDSVKGRITVTLKNVTLEQALDSILRANGYQYRIENGVVVVKPVSRGFNVEEMETRVYRLKYIDAHNLMEAISELKSPEGKIKVLTTSFHNRKDVYEVNNRVAPRREVKYWLRSSVLLVTDFPSNLKAIDKLVQELDKPVPQVMIEAKLIETSPQDKTNIGIDWSKSLAAELFDEVVFEGGTVYRYSSQTPLSKKSGGVTFGTLNTSQFNAVLNFLKTKMNSRLLSNPRILAMDNEPSDISVGTNFPVPQINRGVGGQGDIVTFTYKDVNITLRVVPHVTSHKSIVMYVNPIIEEITGQVTVDKNSAPITSKREVDTVVKVKSGETIVIGGMIKEQSVVRVDKIWFLGSIPLVGHLFRNKSVQKQQTDLLIFITPKIVEP